MKKQTLFITLLVLLSINTLAEDIKRIKSKATDVTVFLNGAQVTRKANVQIPVGKSTIVIEKLTPLILKESIQVKGLGDFIILSVNNRLVYKEKKKETQDLSKLKEEKAALTNEKDEINVLLGVITQQDKLFETNKQIKGNEEGLEINQLKLMLELNNTAIKKTKLEELRYKKRLQQIKKQLNKLTNEINAAQFIEEEVSSEIHLVVESKKTTSAQFKISYLITNARWYPSYDVRVDNVSSPLKIFYKANVSQQSGEDWNDVKLTFSTSNPNKNATKPKLSPWVLRLNKNTYRNTYQQQMNNRNKAKFGKIYGQVSDSKTGEVIPFTTIQVVGTTIGTTTDFDGNYELSLPPSAYQLKVSFLGYNTVTIPINKQQLDIKLVENAVKLEACVVRTAGVSLVSLDEVYQLDGKSTRIRGFRRRGKRNRSPRKISNPININPIQNVVNKQFRVEDALTIPSDMQSYSVQLNEISMEANYQHYCVPKVDPEVFLTAQITGWEKYNLLEGQANIYYEDTYIGKSLLDVRYVTDTLGLSLGRDKSIIVKRDKVKDFSKRQLLGGNKIDSRAIDITIKNTKNEPVNLIVEDQFPTSSNNKIEVTHQELSNGVVNKDSGIILWDLKMKPKESKTIKLMYKVKYPKDSFVGLE